MKIISTQNQITSKKTRPLRRKTAKKTFIYTCHSVKNYFSKSKKCSLNAAHEEKTSPAKKKISSHDNFTQFRF